jgi:prepilin-type N-terminal cleavage/methylation domain-containing protein
MKETSVSKNAFTLIELLVVIAVIAILAALLLPVLGTAEAKVKRTTCLNNLRQINLGVRMYCDDSNDKTPAVQYTGGMTNIPWIAYKELMKNYVGLKTKSFPARPIRFTTIGCAAMCPRATTIKPFLITPATHLTA